MIDIKQINDGGAGNEVENKPALLYTSSIYISTLIIHDLDEAFLAC